MKKNWKTYAFWIAVCTVEIYSATVEKPPLSPPAAVFPVVWTVLYILMGISAARIRLAPKSGNQQKSMNLFIAQLVLNFFWPLFFFNLQAFGLAMVILLVLWVLVLLLTLRAYKIEPLAAWLLIPYPVWLTFAAYLNFGVLILN